MKSLVRRAPLLDLLALLRLACPLTCQTLIGALDGNALPDFMMGTAVAPLGDLDGDGCTDLALGGRGVWPNSSATCAVESGQTLLQMGKLKLPALPDVSQFGSALDGPGDVDGDGVPDVLVGAPGGVLCSFPLGCFGSSRGTASLNSGTSFLSVQGWQGANENDRLGAAVAGLGDVDGDGFPDLAIGAPQRNDTAASGAGYVQVVSGATGVVLNTWFGAQPGDGFGWSVAGPGDTDGDGVRDVLIGAPWAKGDAPASGWAGLYRGNDGTLLESWNGKATDDRFGQVAAGQDVDGNGLPDLLIGAPGRDGPAGSNAGAVAAYAARGAALLELDGATAGSGLGARVTGVGDIDGNGYADVLAGTAPTDPDAPSFARLYSGRGGGLIYDLQPSVPAFSAGPVFLNAFGGTVASAGDANGDGQLDFVLAAPAKVTVSGDHITVFGGQHLFVFSGLPLSVTALPNPPGLPGGAGVPELTGAGSTEPNELLTLHVAQAAPLHAVLLIAGHGLQTGSGSKEGIGPVLDAIVPLGSTDAAGQLDIAGRWPPALGFGQVVLVQVVVIDESAAKGWASSNTLQLTGE